MTHDDRMNDAAETPELSPEDQELWARVARHLASPEPDGVPLGAETAETLRALCPEAELDRALVTRLNDLATRAELDLRFAAENARKKRPATLGDYLTYLRTQAGLTLSEAARKYSLDFQFLTELERDAVRPQQIPARRLATLVRRLKGSLPQTEALLLGTVRAPRYLATAGRGSLYRKGTSSTRSAEPLPGSDVRLVENPEHTEELEAAHRLISEVRSLW